MSAMGATYEESLLSDEERARAEVVGIALALSDAILSGGSIVAPLASLVQATDAYLIAVEAVDEVLS